MGWHKDFRSSGGWHKKGWHKDFKNQGGWHKDFKFEGGKKILRSIKSAENKSMPQSTMKTPLKNQRENVKCQSNILWLPFFDFYILLRSILSLLWGCAGLSSKTLARRHLRQKRLLPVCIGHS